MPEFTSPQITWLERFVRTITDRQVQTSAGLIRSFAYPLGTFVVTSVDLTANTGEYVYTHPVLGLDFLYCNGAAVSQTTYADLYALWGASRYGADAGGDFVLPDTRGFETDLLGSIVVRY